MHALSTLTPERPTHLIALVTAKGRNCRCAGQLSNVSQGDCGALGDAWGPVLHRPAVGGGLDGPTARGKPLCAH